MTGSVTSNQILVRKLKEIVLANLNNEKFGVRELVALSGISRYSLGRRLHSINKKSISQFIREVRLNRALEMLRDEKVTASEVAYKVGFSSPAYFNTCFHEFFGYPPGKAKIEDRPDLEEESLNRITNHPEQKKFMRQIFVRVGILILFLIIIIGTFLVFPGVLKRSSVGNPLLSDDRISVVVLPFQNQTNDTIWDVWQTGIQTSIISYLSNSEEFRVRQAQSVGSLLNGKGLSDLASVTPSLAGYISRKLDAKIFIYGSIIKAGEKVRVCSQIFDAKKGEAIKSFEMERTAKEEMIFKIIDSLKLEIKNFMIISKLRNDELYSDHDPPRSNTSPEAYRYLIYAWKASNKLDFDAAIDLYKQAIILDSTLYSAYYGIAEAYKIQGLYDQSIMWLLRYYKKYDKLSTGGKIWANYLYVMSFKTPYDAIVYADQLIDFDNQSPENYFILAKTYSSVFQFDKAIPAYEKALEIFHNWNVKPVWVSNYTELGDCFHALRQYKKEKKLYKKAEKDFPENIQIIYRQAILLFNLKDLNAANRYLKKYINMGEEQSWSEARIASQIAPIYLEGGFPDIAEECYRQALKLEPENPEMLNNLAYFLIDNDRDIQEGLDLVEKALLITPDNYFSIGCKGWGLYKNDNYAEALEYLDKSWTLRMRSARYDHEAFLHFEEVKKAVSLRNFQR